MSKRWFTGLIAAGFACALLLAACSDQERRQVLTLLFDGVPQEDAAAPTAAATPAGAPAPGQSTPAAARPTDTGSPMAANISAGHAAFAANCEACHGTDAVVTDDHCLTCHGVGPHQGMDLPMTCAACHAEHAGRVADLARVPVERCTDCHDAAPFEQAHPQFSLLDDPEAAAEARFAAGVAFPHSIHAEMEVLEGPREGEPYHCYDCHQLDPMQPDTFQAPSYNGACRICHELDVHQAVLPRTDWQAVRAELPEGADAEKALLSAARWRAFEETAGDSETFAALEAARETMAEQGLDECFRCHAFQDRELDGTHHAVVTPARRTQPWFRWVRFSHSAHTFTDCRTCHRVADDPEAELARVMLPGVQTCAECHHEAGASNNCATCHLFHDPVATYTADPARQQRVRELLNLER